VSDKPNLTVLKLPEPEPSRTIEELLQEMQLNGCNVFVLIGGKTTSQGTVYMEEVATTLPSGIEAMAFMEEGKYAILYQNYNLEVLQ
jgi:hypothetical protein